MSGEIAVVGGRMIRPSVNRGTDPNNIAYTNAAKIKKPDTACTFCPEELERRKIEIVQRIGATGRVGLYVIEAIPSYDHFDGHRVAGHQLIIPDEHIEHERDLGRAVRKERDEFIWEAERNAPEGTSVQSYTRTPHNTSKSIAHLHTHLFTLSMDAVSRFDYNIEEGTTALDFVSPTDEQVRQITDSRTYRYDSPSHG